MKRSIMSYFDLQKTAESGQVFRARKTEDGKWSFIARDKKIVLDPHEDYAGKIKNDRFWREYFDQDRDYEAVSKEAVKNKDDFMIAACKAGEGIRLLKQDPWEMLISFIISQRKSIPAIQTSIERLCLNFGEKKDDFYAFPTPEDLLKADTGSLAECGLGYRLEYVRNAAEKVAHGILDLDGLRTLGDEELLNELKTVKGVGDKVANCIMLFAYGRTSRVPVDVWIKKIIDEDYGGKEPFSRYGEYAGIMQQYAFYFKRNVQ